MRDFGVQISSNLKFNDIDNIGNVVTTASRMVGWAKRTFRSRSRATYIIQIKLDYCSQLWSPSDQASIVMLE